MINVMMGSLLSGVLIVERIIRMITTKLKSHLNLPIPELRGSLGAMRYPAFSELKLDGEFCFVVFNNGKAYTVNKYDKVRSDFYNLNTISSILASKGTAQCTMLAELHYKEGKRNSLYELLKNKENNNLNLYIFDILDLNGKMLEGLPLIDRKEILTQLMSFPSGLGQSGNAVIVVQNQKEAEAEFQKAIANGYEGTVVKAMDGVLVGGPCDWVKLKMKDQTDYMVAEVDSIQERIEILVPNPKNAMPIYVGCKAPLRYKRHIKVGDMVTIEHQGVLDSGSLRHPVLIPKKEWK